MREAATAFAASLHHPCPSLSWYGGPLHPQDGSGWWWDVGDSAGSGHGKPQEDKHQLC